MEFKTVREKAKNSEEGEVAWFILSGKSCIFDFSTIYLCDFVQDFSSAINVKMYACFILVGYQFQVQFVSSLVFYSAYFDTKIFCLTETSSNLQCKSGNMFCLGSGNSVTDIHIHLLCQLAASQTEKVKHMIKHIRT